MTKPRTREQFETAARKVHGDKYDYSHVIYVNSRIRVKMFCQKHGFFEQRPKDHLYGNGCRKCYDESLILSQEEFIKKCKLKHGDVYDYFPTHYKSTRTKVTITCKTHGLFMQRADDHLAGRGCPKCFHEICVSKMETEFLDKMGIPQSNRQFPIPSLKYIADGIDSETDTIYEFLGDYWHGNPEKFSPRKKIMTGVTCGEAYQRTFKRFFNIKSVGYNVKYIWESDWQAWKKNPDDPIPIKEYNG
jgi:hypothetical protein